MGWRVIQKLHTGSVVGDGKCYDSEGEALEAIRTLWSGGLIQSASMQDPESNRVFWSSIKPRLASRTHQGADSTNSRSSNSSR
jgi:hypothetical protein